MKNPNDACGGGRFLSIVLAMRLSLSLVSRRVPRPRGAGSTRGWWGVVVGASGATATAAPRQTMPPPPFFPPIPLALHVHTHASLPLYSQKHHSSPRAGLTQRDAPGHTSKGPGQGRPAAGVGAPPRVSRERERAWGAGRREGGGRGQVRHVGLGGRLAVACCLPRLTPARCDGAGVPRRGAAGRAWRAGARGTARRCTSVALRTPSPTTTPSLARTNDARPLAVPAVSCCNAALPARPGQEEEGGRARSPFSLSHLAPPPPAQAAAAPAAALRGVDGCAAAWQKKAREREGGKRR